MSFNALVCLGKGIVAQNKDTNTKEILVHLPSEFPSADGEVVANVEEVESNSISPTGDNNASKNLISNVVSATWSPMSDTHRITPPDVRVGSEVVLYRLANSPDYIWTTWGLDANARLETVIYGWSANPNIDKNSEFNIDNYYCFIISTHSKKVQFMTGMGNGEPAGFNITLDTAQGLLGVVDTEDNIWGMNAIEKSFSYINADKSFLTVNKKNIAASCEDTLTLSAKEVINFNSKKLNIKASEEINIDTKTTNMISPDFNLEGNLKVKGGIAATEYITSEKGIKTKGDVHSIDGDIIAENVSVKGHDHSGVERGGSKTDKANPK